MVTDRVAMPLSQQKNNGYECTSGAGKKPVAQI